MNSLYVFSVNNCRYYVAASTWKEARNTIAKLSEYKTIPLTDIVGYRLNANCTNEAGILSQEFVFENLMWQACRCGNRSFIPIDDGNACRCRNCGREIRINLKNA